VKLNDREQAFVDAYRGNKKQAAIAAGYSEVSAGTCGVRLYNKPHVRAEIERQARARSKAAIMNREEMQRLFSATARDVHQSMRERLRAAELLGKTRGDFTEKLELKGELNVRDLVRESMGEGGE
jgi:phage terminase small subunit